MRIVTPLLLCTALLLLLNGCNSRRHAASRRPEPLRVITAPARADSMPERMSFIGYLTSNFNAVIQPRVNGYLSSKRYDSGMPVRKGQLLFTIDPVQQSTAMLAAEAELESARAQAIEARNNYERAVPLARINAISQAQLDQYTASYEAAQAAVRSAEQSLRAARLEVDYTKLYSPIDGFIESTAAHVGAYVGPGTQFSVLTTISNFDTMCVDVAIPMTQYLRYARPDRSLYENDGLLSDIRLTLADNRTYPYAGFYGYTRKDVSNDTGTIVLVVKFPNPALTLKAGQFARVEANIGELQPRIMVPQEAVEQTLGVNAVWVVRPDSTVEYRAVELGAPDSTMWGIVSGLAAGEQVVVVGRQRLTNGMKVVPQPQPEV